MNGTLGRGRIAIGDFVKMCSALSTKFKWPVQMVLDLFGRPPVGVATLVDALRPVLSSLVLEYDKPAIIIILATVGLVSSNHRL